MMSGILTLGNLKYYRKNMYNIQNNIHAGLKEKAIPP